MAEVGNSTSGIGFGGLLTLLFIGLKLGHVITWSWWWVLSPMWISLGILVFFLFISIIALAALALKR